MKTSLSGSMNGCAARQIWRLAATSGRSCSLARSVFFIGQSQPIDRAPDGTVAEPDTVLLGQPRLRRRQRDVVMRLHIGGQSGFLFWRQLARPMTSLGTCRDVAGPPSPDKRLVNVRDADLKDRSRRASRHATVNGGKHSTAEIRRIALTLTPSHHHLHNILLPRVGNHTSGSAGIPLSDSGHSGNALGGRDAAAVSVSGIVTIDRTERPPSLGKRMDSECGANIASSR